jgi:hypothetical protein
MYCRPNSLLSCEVGKAASSGLSGYFFAFLQGRQTSIVLKISKAVIRLCLGPDLEEQGTDGLGILVDPVILGPEVLVEWKL